MSRLLALVFVALVAPFPAAAAGTVETGLAAPNEALGRELPYTIYLPEGHDNAARHYPVVYLLHGHNGNETDWLRAGGVAETLDRLIEAGELPPLIVVMPGAGNSWYIDSPGATGRMATALIEDLVAHIERTWPADPRREARAVAGLSMGGFGALRFAIDHPGTFVAAAGLSPAVFVRPPDAPLREDLFGDVFGDPFEPERFARANPLGRVDDLAAVRDPPAFYLTVGDDDGFGFWRGTALLFIELRDVGLEAELRVEDGGHTWDFWAEAIGPALVFLAGHFTEERE